MVYVWCADLEQMRVHTALTISVTVTHRLADALDEHKRESQEAQTRYEQLQVSIAIDPHLPQSEA